MMPTGVPMQQPYFETYDIDRTGLAAIAIVPRKQELTERERASELLGGATSEDTF